MTADPHALWLEIVESAGAKRVAQATGYNISTVYKHTRHPFDSDELNGTGERGILDRFEATVDLLASRASSRVTLRKLSLWTQSLFERALDRGEPRAESPEQLSKRATTALRELADVIDECAKADCDEGRLIHEATEVQAILDAIIRAASAGMNAERGQTVRAIR